MFPILPRDTASGVVFYTRVLILMAIACLTKCRGERTVILPVCGEISNVVAGRFGFGETLSPFVCSFFIFDCCCVLSGDAPRVGRFG